MERQKTFKFKTAFDRKVAIPGLSVLILLSIYCGLFPTQAESVLTSVQTYVYQNMSWVYVLLITFFMVFLVLLACSKAGNIRLGADNSEPQYGFFSVLPKFGVMNHKLLYSYSYEVIASTKSL